MYKIYGSVKTRTLRNIWQLEELGVDYEYIPTGARSEEAFAINPGGKVPVLEFEGEFIPDSAAILQFLADRHGQLTYDPGTIERAKQDSFLHFANDELDATCWNMAKHKFVLPKEYRVEEVFKACAYDWSKSMGVLSKRLGNNQYVMGDDITVPDFIIVQVMNWARLYDFDPEHDNLRAYLDRARSRPAYLRVSEMRKAA